MKSHKSSSSSAETSAAVSTTVNPNELLALARKVPVYKSRRNRKSCFDPFTDVIRELRGNKGYTAAETLKFLAENGGPVVKSIVTLYHWEKVQRSAAAAK